ncbi:GumC family protein [Spirosoma fluviale]|uniref:Uncharacterized protein involved in exopolysaccharide biosynthesis n=1 Tax=Spirosoma fluviale TaxID=1597977 RepID=A0A286GCC0_9BACT|nr:hypothetical protein [Spirosoma fluviale]SOD93138.1 Uncharacterized protein involved in exopolysaccharide biosynthesis [Spirosoma fluviale]
MNSQIVSRLLRQNVIWLLLMPVVAACTAYYFTQNQPRVYESTATLYTGLTSGYSILSNESNARVDHEAVDNAFENLLSTISSRETMAQVSIRLLSRHLMLEAPDTMIMDRRNFNELRKAVPEALRASLVASRNEHIVYQRLDSMAHTTSDNPIKKLLNNPASDYATAKIAKQLRAIRKKDSDMLELSFQADDAGLTYATLTELINVFSYRYAGFKTSETSPVVSYYNNRNQEAIQRLQQAEQRLKAFEANNQIINYDEESRSIALNKDILQSQYNEELMKLKAAKASMDALGKRLDDRMSALTVNDELLTKRQELTTATSQLSQARMAGRPKETIEQLSGKVNRLTDDLRVTAQKYYKAGNSTESLPQMHLLDEWLNRLIQYEESKARLTTYEKRLIDFKDMAAKFTPLGSTLTQIKRDVSVAEKDYMSSMAALNQAKTRQKNAEMTGPLKLLDAPQFPLHPLPSKRWMILGAAFGVGLVLALLLLLVRYLVDGRIYDAGRFEEVTKLPVAASFPRVPAQTRSKKTRVMLQYMLDNLRSRVEVDMYPTSDYRSYVLISIWSPRPKQGKTWLASQLAEQYSVAGKRVALLSPYAFSEMTNLPPDVTAISYEVRSNFAYAKTVDQVVGDLAPFDSQQYDIILLELPDLSITPIATHLVAQSNLLLMAVSARITWNSTDQNLYQLYRKATKSPILSILNHVHPSLIRVSPSAEGPVVVATGVPQPNTLATHLPTQQTV